MSRRNLSPSVWYDPIKGYVMLDVTDSIEPQGECVIDGQVLLPKNEYHCTLVAARKIASDSEQESQIIETISTALAIQPVTFHTLGSDRYVCRKDDQITIIAPIIIDGIDALNAEIKKVVASFTGVFAHVTLLKNENSVLGIGITSLEMLAARCEKI